VVAVLHQSLLLLTGATRWTVPPGQNLTADLSRIPALPRSGFVVGRVRALTAG
jgi:hypothetical protein